MRKTLTELGVPERVAGDPASQVEKPVLRRFGRYEARRMLGSGATGEVYAGHDPLLERMVALKVLHPNLPAEVRDAVLERFRVELRVFGRVVHPHVVAVYDANLEGERPFLVMELCTGPTLADWLKKQGPLSPGKGALALHQAAMAIEHIHSVGVIHRDIKPSNLIFHHRLLKLTDFGVARADSIDLAHEQHLVGTPGYLPPDQFAGEPACPQDDVFALAACLYELLTGQKPFPGDHHSVLYDQVFDRLVPPTQICPDLVPDFDAFFARALAREPARRFQTAAELVAAVAEIVPEHELEAFDGEGKGAYLGTPAPTVFGYGQVPRAYVAYAPSRPLREPPPPLIPSSARVDGAVPAPWLLAEAEKPASSPGLDFELLSFDAVGGSIPVPSGVTGVEPVGPAEKAARSRRAVRPVTGRFRRGEAPILPPTLPLDSDETLAWPDADDLSESAGRSLPIDVQALSTGPVGTLLDEAVPSPGEPSGTSTLGATAGADLSRLDGSAGSPSTPPRRAGSLVWWMGIGLALAVGLVLGAESVQWRRPKPPGGERLGIPRIEVYEGGSSLRVTVPLDRLPEQVELRVRTRDPEGTRRASRLEPRGQGIFQPEWEAVDAAGQSVPTDPDRE